MKKLRILHVIGGGEIGGAEKHLLALLRLLDRNRFDPELLCLCQGPFAQEARQEGFTTHEIVMNHKLDLGTIRPIRALVRDRRIDIIHTHGVRANLAARLAGRRESIPVVTTFHSLLQYDYTSSYEAAMARWLTRLTNFCTNQFIAISGAVREDLLTMGVKSEKISVIYNGLDLSLLKTGPSSTEIRQQLGIRPEQRVIATVARLHPVKGHKHLLAAARQVVRQYPEALFLLVGEGPERPAIERAIREMDLAHHVIMTGFYPEVNDLYPVMEIFVLPSLMEGMGLVLLEAMNFGVPVIATQVGGIPEIIQDGESGLLVSPADSEGLAIAISWLLDSPVIQRQLVTGGRRRSKDFTIDNMTRQTEAIYEKYHSESRIQP